MWGDNYVFDVQMVEKQIGFVGDITSIQPRLLNTLVETGYLPVVASVAADNNGQALNVNADIAAGEVRSASRCLHHESNSMQLAVSLWLQESVCLSCRLRLL